MNPTASPAALPLVMVPGLMCDHAVWTPVWPHLNRPRPLLVADHGDAVSLGEMAERLLHDAPPVFALAGHSMGARVAVEVLRRAPGRVRGLALLDTGYLPRADGAAGEDEARKRHALLDLACTQGVRAMAQTWVQGMVHPDRLGDAALIETIVAMFARRSAEVFAAQIAALLERPDAREVLRGVRVPTLLLCGRQDSWAPVAQHEAMHALLGRGELVVTESAGHMAPMEQPAAVAASLSAWLRVVDSDPA